MKLILTGFGDEVSLKHLIKAQKRLVQSASYKSLERSPNLIAGIDVAYTRDGLFGVAGIVVMKFPELQVVEEVVEKQRVCFPYIPGFLSFREAPLMIKAFRKLKHKPDLLFVDGQGTAHPRKAGIAVHLGVILKIPTIGCAKKPLLKSFSMPEDLKGAAKPIFLEKEQVGWVLRTKKGVKPVFVSPGNLITLEETLDYTLKTTTKYRLPEPIRLAHQLCSQAKKY